MIKISKFGLLVGFNYIVLAFIFRSLLPNGDEPDWIVRAPGVLLNEHPFWSPYNWLSGFLSNIEINSSRCFVQASPLSLWSSIPSSCSEDTEQIFYRWMSTILIISPLIFLAIFKNIFIKILNYIYKNINVVEWNLRIDAVSLSLIFPGVLYYSGLMAEEQLYLIVALLIFLFWGAWIPLVLIIFLLYQIDIGNFFVSTLFVVIMFIFDNYKTIRYLKYYFLLMALIVVSFIYGHELLYYSTSLGLMPDIMLMKTEAIYNSLEDGELISKYPIALRPVVTFMSFSFMTPSGLKAPLVYIFMGYFLMLISFKVAKSKNHQSHLFWFVSIGVVLIFIFIFPNYSNAKYYIFIFPFLIRVALNYFSRMKIFIFGMSMSVAVILQLKIYSI
jgi:hypothetical protein